MNNLVAGSQVLFKARKVRKHVRDVYDKVRAPFGVQEHPIEFLPESCRYKRYMYVRAVIASRAFNMKGKSILTSFADLINHSAPNTRGLNLSGFWFSEKEKPQIGEIGLQIKVISQKALSYGFRIVTFLIRFF